LHTLLLPTFLLIGVSLCEVLEIIVSFPTSPSSLKTEFVCIFYCVFEFGGFTGSFLREVFTSPYLVFYLLLLLGLYGLHWIDLSLSFSKSPSLNRSPDAKVFTIFVFPVFFAGTNPVHRAWHREVGFNPGMHRDFHQEAGFNPVSPACTSGVPAHSPVAASSRFPSLKGFPARSRRKATVTFHRAGPFVSSNSHILSCYKRGFPQRFSRVPKPFLSISLSSIVEPLELASSPFPPMILAYF
jgi:hypothetical protein